MVLSWNWELVHWIKLPELQVVGRAATSLCEQFVQQKLHHQESRTEIETIVAQSHLCIPSTDHILLFENLDAKARVVPGAWLTQVPWSRSTIAIFFFLPA